MADRWADPADDKPGAARQARQVSGWRSYCPIRKALHHDGPRSSYRDSHVLAADRLRLDADAVAIGLSAGRELLPVQAVLYRPLTGPSALAIRNIKAWPRFRAAMALFDDRERELLTWVVLLNKSLHAWCVEHRKRGLTAPSIHRVVHRLVELLDRLVEHYGLDREERSAA